MNRRLWSCLPALTLSLALGVATTSCGGGNSSADSTDLVLLGFNQPNIAGVALNQPLVFTFSAPIDKLSITPDTLRVVGLIGPFFEDIVVDGNLVALLPRSPNFDNYSDAGFAPGVVYSVSFPIFPAVDTITSTAGKPLIEAGTFNFTTVPASTLNAPRTAFVEPRRRYEHGLSPLQSASGNSDDAGCLQNRGSSLYRHPLGVTAPVDPLPQQTNSVAGGRLLCLENEGVPRIIAERCVPRHDQRAVGTPSAGGQNVGKIDLPAIILAFNEQLDPGPVTLYDQITLLSQNVLLYRVASLDGTLIVPEPIKVNKPLIVQKLGDIQVILVASGPAFQGVYMVVVRPTVVDLTQKALEVRPDDPMAPVLGGEPFFPSGSPYDIIVDALPASIPGGYSLFFHTLQIPNTASSLNESWGTSLAEWGDVLSGTAEPGVYTRSTPPGSPLATMAGVLIPAPMSTHSLTLLGGPIPGTSLTCGQTTTANWNGEFRFLNLASLDVNTEADPGLGRLKAVFKPYLGDGGDGVLDSAVSPFSAGPGDTVSLTTTPGFGASANQDGIFEYESFNLRTGDTMTVTGSKPLVILCRGPFIVDGTIDLSGLEGSPGLNTDGSTDYSNAGAALPWGSGGPGGPGGGLGGRGAGPIGVPSITAGVGGDAQWLFGPVKLTLLPPFGLDPDATGGQGGPSADALLAGGGAGGGFGIAGAPGTRFDGSSAANTGPVCGTPLFERHITRVNPDRCYSPNTGISGGLGGGGGGLQDDSGAGTAPNGTPDNGDDGGGGGGGGGGGIWVIAGGAISVGGTIRADGGAGGNTYARADQDIAFGADNALGGGDDFVTGVLGVPVPSGAGGPGGGGSGGGIFLVSEAGVTISGTLSAAGGPGGLGAPPLQGGTGGGGRVCLMGIGFTPGAPGGTVTPAAAVDVWRPTVRLDSVGQSGWYDLFVNTVVFNPVTPPGVVPTFTSNFATLTGLGVTNPTHYQYEIEYQAATDLLPLPGAGTPTGATGLTQWDKTISLCNGKRYFRYRVRWKLSPTYPATGLSARPMPCLFDLTIPYVK